MTDAPTKPQELHANDPERFFRTDKATADLKRRTIRGGAATVASEIAKQLLWLTGTIILARLLTPADTGLIAMVLVVTGFVEMFSDMGLSAATIQRQELNQDQVSTLFWVNVAVSIMLLLVLVALAPAIAWFYGEPRLLWITIAMSASLLFSGLTIQHRALLRRQLQFTALAVTGVILVAVEAAAGITAAMAGLGYWALVIMRLISGPLEVLALWLICPWRPGRPSPAAGVRSMLAFGGHLTGFRLLNYAGRNVDNLLIGMFYGAGPLGIYAKAYSLLLLPLHAINNPIASVAVPALSRLVGSPERYREAYTAITGKICLLTMPLVAFMIGTADWVVLLLLGPQWSASGTIFRWLGVSGLLEPFAFTLSWLLISQGYTRRQFHWGVISTTIIILAIVAGLPWGPTGVAVAYGLVSLLIRMPLLFWFVGRQGLVPTGSLYRIVAPFCCAAVVTLLGIFIFRRQVDIANPLIGLASAGALTAATTLLTLGLLPSGRLVLRDLRSIPGLLVLKKREL